MTPADLATGNFAHEFGALLAHPVQRSGHRQPGEQRREIAGMYASKKGTSASGGQILDEWEGRAAADVDHDSDRLVPALLLVDQPDDELLPFRSSLLEAAFHASADVAIRPVALDYGDAASEIDWPLRFISHGMTIGFFGAPPRPIVEAMGMPMSMWVP